MREWLTEYEVEFLMAPVGFVELDPYLTELQAAIMLAFDVQVRNLLQVCESLTLYTTVCVRSYQLLYVA